MYFFNYITDKFKPLLNHLLYLADEQNAFSDTEIREHLNTFVIAAYDTSTVSLTLLLMMIGWHKGVQERVYNEYVFFLKFIYISPPRTLGPCPYNTICFFLH